MNIFLVLLCLSWAGGGISGSSSSAATAQEGVDEPSGDSFRDAANHGAHEILCARLTQRVCQYRQLFLGFL